MKQLRKLSELFYTATGLQQMGIYLIRHKYTDPYSKCGQYYETYEKEMRCIIRKFFNKNFKRTQKLLLFGKVFRHQQARPSLILRVRDSIKNGENWC